MFDFSLTKYSLLLKALLNTGFSFQTFNEFISNSAEKVIVLRHDVDKLPINSFHFAEIESRLNIKSSFHFRITKESCDIEIIKKIVSLGHEIGYHYEDISNSGRLQNVKIEKQDHRMVTDLYPSKGTIEFAYNSFMKNLEYLKIYYPVTVISMHGSPRSKYDNRELWKYYDYKSLMINCEPYFDIDHSDILYLTDTGRRWNGNKVIIRDKASVEVPDIVKNQKKLEKREGRKNSHLIKYIPQNPKPFQDWVVKPIPGSLMNMTEDALAFQSRYNFSSTDDIIKAAYSKELPDKIIINTHPQRWSNEPASWIKELVFQNFKNVVKFYFVKWNHQNNSF
jgi:hypothetical protein